MLMPKILTIPVTFYRCMIRVLNMQPPTSSFVTSTDTNHANTSSTNVIEAKDHLTVTSTQSRDPDAHEVIVSKISVLSPTVKHLTLYTTKRPIPFSFKAGQWIDMIIPGVEQVGGFSITSSPTHLLGTGEFHLAVKYSESPPSKWVHTKCKEGSIASIRIGGDFHLDLSLTPEEQALSQPTKFVFIAGGVGINPLASMISEIRDVNFTTNEGKQLQVALLYSATTHQELIFREEFDAIKRHWFKPFYFVTGEKQVEREKPDLFVKYNRITLQDIKHVIEDASNAGLRVYLCGPQGMTRSLQLMVTSLGVQHIYFEKWW